MSRWSAVTSVLALALCSACPDSEERPGADASVDASIDAGPDAAVDAGPDAAVDAAVDASPDAAADASPHDGGQLAPIDQLDLLLVVDDSVNMDDEQALMLQVGLPELVSTLVASHPDISLHLGVITTTVGIPGTNIFNCIEGGGAMRAPSTCVSEVSFLRDEPAPSGIGRVRNSALSLTGAATCLAEVGTPGCGFEQPLESIRLALANHPGNVGFLREDAALLVVVVSDEDDCSIQDPAFADTAGDFASVLGPLRSFRCTEFGVRCAEGSVIRSTEGGAYTGCQPDFDSPYLHSPAAYSEFLLGLKKDPRRVAMVNLVGPEQPFATRYVDNDGLPFMALQASCGDGGEIFEGIDAVPAIRLNWVAAQLHHHDSQSICEVDSHMVDAVVAGFAAMGQPLP